MPTPEHIIEKQLYNLADRLERVQVNEAEIDKYLPGVRKKLEWLSEEDLLKRVLSLEFNRLLQYYQNMPDIDLNATGSDRADRRDRERAAKRERPSRQEKDRRHAEAGYERLMLNIGKAQGFFPGNLTEMVNRNVNGPKPQIGRIDLMPDYTLFDVRKEDAHRVLDALKHEDFFGDKVRAEIATDRDYALEGKDRAKKRSARKSKEETPKKERKGAKSGAKTGAKGGSKTSAKGKNSSKPEYNGNYDVFMKKK